MERFKVGMSKREAIKKMGCEEKQCKHLDPKGPYTFCRALFTEDMCNRKSKENK